MPSWGKNAYNRLGPATSATCCRSRPRIPGTQIAVGGCLAQGYRAAIIKRAPRVDVVFRHAQHWLPAGAPRSAPGCREEAQVEILESLERFPSARACPPPANLLYSAWVAISVGCNNTCTFCIVPSLRGREEDRLLPVTCGRDQGRFR